MVNSRRECAISLIFIHKNRAHETNSRSPTPYTRVAMKPPFTYRLRVRYHECDGQKIVFNARYGEYADIAALEFMRHIFGAVTPEEGGIDWRLVKQSLEWRRPAHFDDVLDVRVRAMHIGTTSFSLEATVVRGEDHIASIETVYVVYDEATASKAKVPDRARARILAGGDGVVVDCSVTAPPIM